MEIFLDTANIEEIKKAKELGVISGVTTNPSLIAKEGRNLVEVIKDIANLVDMPINAEVEEGSAKEMVKEGVELAKIHKNIVIKIPMGQEGLKAVKELNEKNIKTNVTLIFSAMQGLLAAKAGATYVSPFLGRLDDIGNDGVKVVEEISKIFKNYKIETKIIAASIRSPKNVLDVANIGSDIATIPYKLIMQMINHPLTRDGIEKFKLDSKI